MRDLTDAELALAPEWSDRYSITSGNNVRFHDDDMFCLCNGFAISDVAAADAEKFQTRPIPRKPFDITQHEWSCGSFYSSKVNGDSVILEGDYCVDYTVNKSDAIAIAKHFKLKAEDLA